MHGTTRKSVQVLVGKPKGKIQLKDQSIDGIKMDLKEIGREGVEWIHLAQDRNQWCTLVNTVMNLCVLVPWSRLAT
jgi:hypothetical protein